MLFMVKFNQHYLHKAVSRDGQKLAELRHARKTEFDLSETGYGFKLPDTCH